MKDQLVLHLSPLLFSFDLRGMRRSSKAKAAKAKKEDTKPYKYFIIHKR
jgi:hypothetical protein